MEDREHARSYYDKKGVLVEVRLNAAVLQEAKAKALSYIKNGIAKKQVTIKLYEDGDIVHQWDCKNSKWVQFE